GTTVGARPKGASARLEAGSRPFAAVNSPRLRFPVMFSLCGAHLLGDRLFTALVSDPLEALALELGELDAVGGMGDVEVKHSPDERETAGLSGLGATLDLAEGSLEQVGRSPAAAVSDRVAQVHDKRVEVVSQALGP